MLLALLACGFVSDAELDARAEWIDTDAHDTATDDTGLSDDTGADTASDTGVDTTLFWVEVTAGDDFTCARDSRDRVHCWGRDDDGQSSPPSGTFRSVEAGADFACGLRNGGVTCWGAPSNPAVLHAPAIGSWRDLGVGGAHACANDLGGDVTCWGDPTDGALAATVSGQLELVAGDQFTCGLSTTGLAQCWGRDSADQQGFPTNRRFHALAAGGDTLCGALRFSDEVQCWGGPPADLLAAASVDLDVADDHACMVRDGGRLLCWGDDAHGRASPPAGDYVRVAVGRHHGCAIRTDGAIACWGLDSAGQAPDGILRPPP